MFGIIITIRFQEMITRQFSDGPGRLAGWLNLLMNLRKNCVRENTFEGRNSDHGLDVVFVKIVTFKP